MNKSELRKALQAKLEHRRQLMGDNARLRDGLSRERAKNDFLLKTIANPLVDMVLEECADHIMKAVVDQAVQASKVVAEQTLEDGHYVVGLDIPSLHIRRHIYREHFDDAVGDVRGEIPIKRVHYDAGRRTTY